MEACATPLRVCDNSSCSLVVPKPSCNTCHGGHGYPAAVWLFYKLCSSVVRYVPDAGSSGPQCAVNFQDSCSHKLASGPQRTLPELVVPNQSTDDVRLLRSYVVLSASTPH